MEPATGKKSKTLFSAQTILGLLAAKHSKDVFIPECKDGPTHYSSHMRIDAWVMNRSWAHPVATAYEIKVSRRDFVNDNKWHGYLPLCNQFYFVAPPDLINLSELPPEAGLMTVANSRLITKKKAPHRAITIPEDVYRYILMCRVIVGRSENQVEFSQEDRINDWKRFVERKAENRNLGYKVSKAIRETADAFKIENERLKKRMEEYDDIRELLKKLEIEPHGYSTRWSVEQKIKEQQELFPPRFVWAMRDLKESLDKALKIIDPKEKDQAVNF